MKFLLKQLVETESPSADKTAVDRVGVIIADEARRIGADVEIVPIMDRGNHVVARFHPSSKSFHPSILLLCHMDTVFPLSTLEKMPFREADGKIFGPGVLDMKAGIVISLAAIEELQKFGGLNHPVTLLCTSDEETGSLTSEDLIKELAQKSELVLVLESALLDGSLKTWRKAWVNSGSG